MVPTYAVDFSFSLLFGCRFRSEGGTKVCKTKYYKDRFVLAVISEINNSEQYSSDEQNLILFSDHLLILCSSFIDMFLLYLALIWLFTDSFIFYPIVSLNSGSFFSTEQRCHFYHVWSCPGLLIMGKNRNGKEYL